MRVVDVRKIGTRYDYEYEITVEHTRRTWLGFGPTVTWLQIYRGRYGWLRYPQGDRPPMGWVRLFEVSEFLDAYVRQLEWSQEHAGDPAAGDGPSLRYTPLGREAR